MELRKYQLDALGKMKTGCILCGGVGSGKSLTSLSYFYLKMGGDVKFLTGDEEYIPMDDTRIEDLSLRQGREIPLNGIRNLYLSYCPDIRKKIYIATR